jgi:hypothetical protein
MIAQSVKEKPAPPAAEVRTAVRDLLTRSAAFSKLPPATQHQIAKDTAEIAGYLARPEGLPAETLPTAAALTGLGPTAGALVDQSQTGTSYQDAMKEVDKVGTGFKAVAAREGAEVAGTLLQKVNFPDFCAKLIQGVFHAIVQSSIEQMEAYGKLVASVSKSLNQFRDENVSDNQGRDHLVEQFPDMFKLGTSDGGDFMGTSGGGQPRVQLKDGVDEDQALKRVNDSLPTPVKSLDLSDEDNEHELVQSARTQLATSRQQLLATMVLMGINRIVVTDGKIQAKIMYDFQARDNTRRQRSATAMDYARDQSGNVQSTYGSEGDYENKSEGGETQGKEGTDSYDQRDGNYYSKGTYKYTQQPIITAMSTATETSESALQTKASLSGVVDINFKSDYLPLEKMADSFQIGMIQNASKPGRAAGAPAGASPAASPATTPAGGTTPATGTGAAAAQPKV